MFKSVALVLAVVSLLAVAARAGATGNGLVVDPVACASSSPGLGPATVRFTLAKTGVTAEGLGRLPPSR